MALGTGMWWTPTEVATVMRLPERATRSLLTALAEEPDSGVERTGSGRKGDPFRYRLRWDVFAVNDDPYDGQELDRL